MYKFTADHFAHRRHGERPVIALVLLFVAVMISSLLSPAPAFAGAVTGSGGGYVSTTGRLPTVNLTANTAQTVKVAGLAGIPTTGVGAVEFMATVANPAAQGLLSAEPDGGSGWTDIEVYDGGSLGNTSNTAVVAVGADGAITLRAQTSVKVLLDVEGYYTATSASGKAAPGGFSPVAGGRIADTRNGTGVRKGTIGAGGSVTVQVTGKAGVPAGAQAVVANFTVVKAGGKAGYITPYPAGTSMPATSLNYPSADTVTTISAHVAVSDSGQVTIANPASASSTIDLVVDIEGYYSAGNTAGSFTPGVSRLYDSRVSPHKAVAGGKTITVPIAGGGGIVPNVSDGLTAAVVDLTVIEPGSKAGFARAWADGTAEPSPFTSIDYADNAIRTNTITVPVGLDGAIEIHNVSSDTVNYVVDLEGWYSGGSSTLCPSDSDMILGDAANSSGTIGAATGSPVVSAVVDNTLNDQVAADVFFVDSAGNPVAGSPIVTGDLQSGSALVYHLPTDNLVPGAKYTWWIHLHQDDGCAAEATSTKHTFVMGTSTAVPAPAISTATITGDAVTVASAESGPSDCSGGPCPLQPGALSVGSDGTGSRVSTLKADLSAVPAGSTVLSADLELTPIGCLNGSCMSNSLSIAEASSDVASISTGSDAPALATVAQQSYDEATSKNDYDITGIVQDWRDAGAAGNYGAVLSETAVASGTGGESFASPSDAANPASIVVHYLAPATPSAVRNLTVQSGDGGLLATWAAPSTSGWSDASGQTDGVSEYDVAVTTATGQPVLTRTVHSTRAVLSDLTNGGSYTVSVTAVNPVGAGTSNSSASVSPRAVAGSTTDVAIVQQLLAAEDSLQTGDAVSTQDATASDSQAATVSSALGTNATGFESVLANESANGEADTNDSTALSDTLVVATPAGSVVYTTATETYITQDTSTGTEEDVPGESVDNDAFLMGGTPSAPAISAQLGGDDLALPVTELSPDTLGAPDSGDSSDAGSQVLSSSAANSTAPKTTQNRAVALRASLAVADSKVAKWADANWNGTSNGFGDDCTDFLSRALHNGGGLPEVGTPTDPKLNPKSNGWYDKVQWVEPRSGVPYYGWTYSWSFANHSYTYHAKRGATSASRSSARAGDLIYVTWNPKKSNGIDHAGVISKVTGSNIYIDQHTNNRYREPLYKQSGTRTTWQNAEPHLAYKILDPSKE